MITTDAIRILRENEAALRASGVRRLYLFGSTARGDQRRDSDVDLFFEAASDLTLIDLVKIHEMTEEILGCPVHIMERDGINSHYRPYIEPDALPVF